MSTHKIPPPGLHRPYPAPDQTGSIPFEYAKNNMKGITTYWIWGDLSSDQTPLICLHGGPGIPHNYLLPISLIYTDYRIPMVMYDQIGCGKSTRFQDHKEDVDFWTPDLFMAELDNVKTHLGIKEFDLLGQSWGGMLAAQYAIERQPRGLRKLIIANSPSNMQVWQKVANELRAQLPRDIQDTLDRCEHHGKTDSPEYEEATMEFYKRHICRVHPFPQEVNHAFACLAEDNTVYLTMCGPSEFLITGSLKSWSIIEDLNKITPKTCPGGMLIVNGHYDEAQDETCAPFFTNPTCKTMWKTYPLSSHFPFTEEPEKFLLDLGRFLSL